MTMRTTMPIASRRAFVGLGASDEDREGVRARWLGPVDRPFPNRRTADLQAGFATMYAAGGASRLRSLFCSRHPIRVFS